jgi:hypothetical protein
VTPTPLLVLLSLLPVLLLLLLLLLLERLPAGNKLWQLHCTITAHADLLPATRCVGLEGAGMAVGRCDGVLTVVAVAAVLHGMG